MVSNALILFSWRLNKKKHDSNIVLHELIIIMLIINIFVLEETVTVGLNEDESIHDLQLTVLQEVNDISSNTEQEASTHSFQATASQHQTNRPTSSHHQIIRKKRLAQN